MRARKLFLITALLATVAAVGWAQSWGFSTVANISATMGVNDGRVCVGEGSRQDIGCPTYAPSVSSGGLLTATTIATGGLTVTGATSLSTISATIGDFTTLRVNGVPVTGGGGAASPTNVPAFSVYRSTNQTGIGFGTVIQFNAEEFDTFNNYDTTTHRFTPTIAGNYLITVMTNCVGSAGGCHSAFRKNGTFIINYGPGPVNHSIATGIVYLNGTTDYVEGFVWGNGETLYGIAGGSIATRMTGSLLASGNGLISGSTALGDRITSSTTAAVIANESGGTVSFTLGGTAGAAYLHPTLGLVAPGVSTTGTISASQIFAGTNLQLLSPTAPTACNGSTAGSLRYNSPTTTLELCTGSGWQPMGVGIPAGTISAFASTTCPVGWSEYTPARGRFLRGIDNGAGNDPAGTRAPGNVQGDAFKSHNHSGGVYANAGTDSEGGTWVGGNNNVGVNVVTAMTGTSTETRPKNVAITYCQFNGTSNGWNNPLSGGSTVPGGSTGAVQYNTSGSFDGSGNFTWTNASSLLTINGTLSATNISATRLTVNGVDITGGGNADRIISGTSNAIVNSATGVISFTQLGTATAYLHPTLGLVAPGVSTTGGISGTTGYFAGNVGIGAATLPMTASAAGITISSTAGLSAGIRMSAGGSNWEFLVPSSNGNWGLYNAGQAQYYFYAVSATRAMGIGSTSPAVSLTVVGEVQVSNSGVSCSGTTAGAIRYNSNALSFCNGTAWTALGSGGTASPTNVPAFSVTLASTQSTPTPSANALIQFNTVNFDIMNNFNTTTYRFTPNISGRYLITLLTACQLEDCVAGIRKNGIMVGYGPAGFARSNAAFVINMNGTTDYIDAVVFPTVAGNSLLVETQMTGSLLASGNGLISGTSGPLDRISSSNSQGGVVATDGGTISFTLGGTEGRAYLDTNIGLVAPGVSTTGIISASGFRTPGNISASIISATTLQLVSASTSVACNSGNSGSLRYNSPTTTIELCTGSGWQPMGVGIPAGTISAFASTTCPVGWSEYTAARGRFLRGIDNGAGNDPAGTRAPGNVQADDLVAHAHTYYGNTGTGATGGGFGIQSSGAGLGSGMFSGNQFGLATTSVGGTETRPKNVAITYCQFNGTSNGWNNPLSGGSTVPGGSTGAVQYNTSGSFDGSGNFTWTNASSLLSITGTLSATNVFGLNISGTSGFFPNATITALSAGAVAASSISSGLVSATNISGTLAQITRISSTNVSGSVGDFTTLRVNGVPVGSGGVARLASLTDVSLSNLTGLDILRYNGTSWTNVNVQNAISTTTMIANVPDQIFCNGGGSIRGMSIYSSDGTTVTYTHNGLSNYTITYNIATGAYVTNSNIGTYDCVTNAWSIGQLYAAGRAFNFIGGSGTVTPTVDRITSGTSNAIVNSATGVISFTQLGTATAYLHPTLGLVAPGVSTTGPISATSVYAGTAIQLASPTVVTACNASSAGTLRYNSPTTTIELCTGSGWQPMGVGIPAGTISAFASTTCPVGWSEYTPARGRFLRGIDNGAGNDPAGTRTPGNTQLDAIQSHSHDFDIASVAGSTGLYNNRVAQAQDGSGSFTRFAVGSQSLTSGARSATETRPVNVAVTYCQFNGTSNGWNNPLSGGSTVPGGSTGAVQYNTSGSFDGSGNFTWSNASSLLSITGTLSATNVYGLNISGTNGFFPSLSAGAIAANSLSSTLVSASNISATRISGSVADFTTLRVNGVPITGSGGTPGGVSGSIQFNGNGTFAGRNDLVIDSAGRVGIGTSTPNASLTVVGRVSATTVQVGRDSVACGSGDLGALRLDPSTGRLQVCRQ